MESKTRSSLENVRIELGRIIEVDYVNHTCTCRSEVSEQYSYRVPVLSPYINQTTTEGFKWMPRGGELVLMAILSDSTRRILAYTGVDEEGSHNYGFGEMNGGDFFIRGGNDSFIRMRSGGVIEIGSSPLCSSIYIPTKNITHHIAENWILDTFAGSLEFKTDRAEDSDEGHTPTFMTLNIKEFADDENELVRCKIGGGQNNIACSLIIKDSGNGENIKIKLELTKDGDLNVNLERDLKLSVKGKVQITSSDDMSLESKTNLSLKAAQELSQSGNSVKVKSNTSFEVQATTTNIKSSNVRISNTALFPVLRASPDLIAVLTAAAAVANLPLSDNHFNTTILV